MTECNQESFAFTAHFSRRAEAGFTAGQVSTDGGALLLREADRKIRLLVLLAGKRNLDQTLAGKSTLNRLELVGRSGRYRKITYSTGALDRLLVDLFIESHAAPPAVIVLDLDATDIPIYGHQPERFFHRGPHGQGFVRGVARLLRQLLLSSADEMKGNQLRLYFSALAYTLMEALLRRGLKGTEWAEAQVDTIRLKLLKIGAIVKVSVRRVLLQLSSAHPWKDQYAAAFHALRC